MGPLQDRLYYQKIRLFLNANISLLTSGPKRAKINCQKEEDYAA
jgi:hypothetical protein